MKRNLLIIISSGVMLILFSGCQRYLPELKTKPVIAVSGQIVMAQNEDVPAITSAKEEIFSVSYKISGRNVLIECFVPDVSFRNNDERKLQLGKIAVWIDGKKLEEVRSAAFMLKNLSLGNHRIKLELLKLTNESYGADREFLVSISK
ncbi:MAG: hypothetical protein Q8906_01580 [Bacillota bacterium]|nr:hypothetical protein [Bacillota bacterium]MDP4169267.1 hypothetical protein [Bacillota bacterium]